MNPTCAQLWFYRAVSTSSRLLFDIGRLRGSNYSRARIRSAKQREQARSRLYFNKSNELGSVSYRGGLVHAGGTAEKKDE